MLGVAVDASTVALFGDSIDEAEGPLGRPSVEDVENSVVIHEVGHLLGLVNLVYQSPVDHEDADHPGHSNNDELSDVLGRGINGYCQFHLRYSAQ